MFEKKLKFLICVCLFANVSYATDYFVDDNANTGDIWTASVVGNDANNGLTSTTPKATIADVLNDYVLGAGDVIYVDAGTYSETGINIGTSDDGSGASYMTIRGAGTSLTIFNNTSTANTFYFNTSSVQYIKVMDLRVNKNSTSYCAVEFTQSALSYIWFENCILTQASGTNGVVKGSNTSTANSNIKFNNCTITNTATGSSPGFRFNDDFDNTTISNCTISTSGTDRGICITNSGASTDPSNVSIFSNTINMNHASSANVRAIEMLGKTSSNIYSNTITMSSTSNSAISIYINNLSALVAYNSNIYSNTISSYGTGILVTGEDGSNPLLNISIYSNIITLSSSSSGHKGIYIRAAGSSGNPINVYKNKIRSGNYGIELNSNTSYCNLYNNYISNSYDGIYVTSSSPNSDLYFNSIYATHYAAYLVSFDSNMEVINNIFHTTSASSSDYAFYVQGATKCSVLNYNLYYAPNGAKIGFFDNTGYTTFASWKAIDKVSSGSLGDENAQNGDPKFVNAASNDLDIHNASSKAYQLGTPAGSITTDIYGTTRHASTPWIGAFENEVTLSVELLYFNANEYDNEVQLNWSTSSETQNDYFIIERSKDGKSFEEISREKGSGNSIRTNYYFSIDFSPYKGISYYRLKQVDFDGKYTYSHIQSVDMEGLLSIYPNPSKDKFYIFGLSKTGNVKINVININGVELYNVNYFNNGISTVDLTSKPEGIYFVKIIDGENEWLEKIVKVE